MKRKFLINLLLSFGVTAVVAGVGSIFVSNGMQWMMGLVKPSEWVPNILIPIVWSVIYVATATTIYLWISRGNMPIHIVVLFIVNGVMNIVWCLLFFQLHLILVGLVAIIINLIVGIVLWIGVYRERRISAYILSIYPLWLCIATTLNLALWILN